MKKLLLLMAVVVAIAIIGILANLFLPEPPTRKDEAAEAKAAAEAKEQFAIIEKSLRYFGPDQSNRGNAYNGRELTKADLEKVTKLLT